MNVQRPLTGAERVARRRAALRAQGLRPRTFWVPDRNSEAWQRAAREDSLRLKAWYDGNPEVMGWVEAMTDDVLAALPPEDFDY